MDGWMETIYYIAYNMHTILVYSSHNIIYMYV